MKSPFFRSVLSTFALLLAWCAVAALAEFGPRPVSQPARGVMRAVRVLDERGPNRQAREEETVGYYEAILNTTEKERTELPLEGDVEAGERADVLGRENYVQRHDYMQYELPTNANLPGVDPRFDLVTNRFGMADQEYDLEKAPGTRRIAVIGDSIAFGYGIKTGQQFHAVLEHSLNARVGGLGLNRVELLNFGVPGYRMTQFVEVAHTRLPAFSPDAVVVTITPLSLVRRWGAHVVSLLEEGVDLKYPFLRQVVADAGVQPSDPLPIKHAKLTRFRSSVLRWGLGELKMAADRMGAPLVVALVPSAVPFDVTDEQFDGIPELVRSVGLPVVDLLAAYEGASVEDVRVGPGDNHPNERGHALIAALLATRIETDPELRSMLLGLTAR